MYENLESSIHHDWYKWKIWFKSIEKKIIEAFYSLRISREKELGEKMLKTTIKVTFSIKDSTVESMQCLS